MEENSRTDWWTDLSGENKGFVVSGRAGVQLLPENAELGEEEQQAVGSEGFFDYYEEDSRESEKAGRSEKEESSARGESRRRVCEKSVGEGQEGAEANGAGAVPWENFVVGE